MGETEYREEIGNNVHRMSRLQKSSARGNASLSRSARRFIVARDPRAKIWKRGAATNRYRGFIPKSTTRRWCSRWPRNDTAKWRRIVFRESLWRKLRRACSKNTASKTPLSLLYGALRCWARIQPRFLDLWNSIGNKQRQSLWLLNSTSLSLLTSPRAPLLRLCEICHSLMSMLRVRGIIVVGGWWFLMKK